MRNVYIAAFSVIASSAWASFDLMIIPDQVTGGYVRYDPINRVYLGVSYLGGARSVAAVSSRSFGYYVYGAGTVARDNFTGEQLSNSTNSLSMTLNESGAVGARYSVTGALMLTVGANGVLTSGGVFSSPSGFNLVGVISTAENRWIAYGTSTNGLDLHMFDNSGALLSSSLGAVAPASLTASGVGQGALVQTPSTSSDHVVIPYRDNGGAHRLLSKTALPSSIGSTISTIALSNFSVANTTTHLSAVRSHVGFFLVGADSSVATSVRISQFEDSFAPSVMQSYSTSSFTSFISGTWRMSNLVAPEPGTMAALGGGVFMLLRRRRKRS